MITAKRKVKKTAKKSTKSKVSRATRTTRHKSMMTGKQSKSPFFIDDVPTLI